MLDPQSVVNIKSWATPGDVGAFNQWLDSLQNFAPVFKEHNLTMAEGMSLYVTVQMLDKLATIKSQLQEIIDNDVGKGDTPA